MGYLINPVTMGWRVVDAQTEPDVGEYYADRIYLGKNGVWDDAIQNIRAPNPAEILAARRAQIIEQINTERDRRTTLGVPYVWPDGLSGSIQTRHQDDIMNMTGQVLTATLLTMQGVTDPVLWFIDANNVRHDMTPAQMITAGFAMQAHLSSVIDAARTMKDAVLAAEDPELIDINAGWPE